MKKAFRSVLTFVLALAMMVTCVGGTAFAASSVSTTVGGHGVSAKITQTGDRATATTKITGVTNAYVTAEANLYYKFSKTYYYSFKTDAQTNGYAAATATKELGGAEVCGALGRHFLRFFDTSGTHLWEPDDTTTGYIPSNPELA